MVRPVGQFDCSPDASNETVAVWDPPYRTATVSLLPRSLTPEGRSPFLRPPVDGPAWRAASRGGGVVRPEAQHLAGGAHLGAQPPIHARRRDSEPIGALTATSGASGASPTVAALPRPATRPTRSAPHPPPRRDQALATIGAVRLARGLASITTTRSLATIICTLRIPRSPSASASGSGPLPPPPADAREHLGRTTATESPEWIPGGPAARGCRARTSWRRR